LIDCDWFRGRMVLMYLGLNNWVLWAPHQFMGALLLY